MLARVELIIHFVPDDPRDGLGVENKLSMFVLLFIPVYLAEFSNHLDWLWRP